MDEFPGLLARDFGFRPQGKSAPMSAAKTGTGGASRSFVPERSRSDRSGGGISGDRPSPGYDDVFGGPPKYSNPSPQSRAASSSPPFEPVFDGFKDPAPKHSSLPVYDKPVYDDDIFDGVPGLKNPSAEKFDDVFAMMSSASASRKGSSGSSPQYDDLLGSLGREMPEVKGSAGGRSQEVKEQDMSGFEDLLPGFGRRSSPQQRVPPDTKQQSAAASAKAAIEDPFAVFDTTSTSARPSSGVSADPLERLTRPMNSGSPKDDTSPFSGGLFENKNLSKSIPIFTSKRSDSPKNKYSLKTEKERSQRSSRVTFENITPQNTRSSDSPQTAGRNAVLNPDAGAGPYERNGMADQSPRSYAHLEASDDVWLTVAEIPLFTQPTSAPPPSRLPPPFAIRQAPLGKVDQFSSLGVSSKSMESDITSQSNPFHQHIQNSTQNMDSSSPLDDLDDFVSGKSQKYSNENVEVPTYEEETDTNSAAAAMKEAMDRAEAKFKHAREVRERGRDTKPAKNRESAQQERYEKGMPDMQNSEEDEDKQERLVREKELSEREEKKRREKEREIELERQKARQAVERATREARERAASEARQKAERAAVEKASAEARQRAERAAFQKAQAEARERAAAEAREKSERERTAAEAREKERAAAEAWEKERAAAEAREKERIAAEAREKERAAAEVREKERSASRDRAAVERAAQEARLRAQRAAVERVATEARERAAAEAQRRAAAATMARENQQKTENDIESFFNIGVRPSSAPKQRNPTSEAGLDAQFQNKGSGGFQRTSPSSSATMRKTHSTTNITDDLASIFGASSSSAGDFQEVEGESEERRRARLERHQRTLERAAKALTEKNERDMQVHRDQAERDRIGETLDFEIKRWAAGKEGNLRALLSTLQYVLWPECGWQPVSLTDLITGASVKKVYRKATLCIHPDKVQQKGATLQQKYIAEKVFDLLKEAWNKLNSEELF